MKSVYRILLLVLLSAYAHASHLRGGEILARHLSGQTYDIRVKIYLDTQTGQSAAEALNSVTVCMGDGAIKEASRLSMTTVSKGVSVGEYQVNYTYPAAGIYQISTALDTRTNQILNLPQAELTSQFLWTVIDTQSANSTPVLPDLEFEAGVRQVFSIDLKPIIADNDSMGVKVVRLSRPSPGTCGVRMLDHSYRFPNEVSATGTFKVDAAQKKLVWTAPEVVGNYLFAMVVTEWRDGIKISESYREGMVTVIDRPGDTVEVPPYESSEYGGVITSTPVVSSSEVSMAVQAYPVPTENFVTVKAYSKQRDIIRLQLIDMNGRILTEIASKTPEISVQEVFDMRNLARGMYLIRASNAKDSVTQKVLR
ncbi:T9SS type A sorting domain-containing protein [Dyadobacter jiangsuensis]|uniref:T9SS type A sorting domain-containing protein n=1 Tax=Dyadobacter fermentans TaxID=94254 RepID=UPI001CBA8ECB|nr:T9SS type A sorting domain-containing protein [Dyadobacter fermentans]MBZ1359876.1 T9SS type A sorting domain-containing protein [Dyadobacter fermentans]